MKYNPDHPFSEQPMFLAAILSALKQQQLRDHLNKKNLFYVPKKLIIVLIFFSHKNRVLVVLT